MTRSDLTAEETSQALDATVDELLAGANFRRPPVDAVAVAASLGLSLAWDEGQAGRARLVRLSDMAGRGCANSILLRPEPRPERLQWAVAHELGEGLAPRIFARLGVDACEVPSFAREAIANQWAGHLLLPTDWLLRDASDCDWDLLSLKRQYSTASHELIARRMLEFPPQIILTVFDQGKMTWRKGNFGDRPPMMSRLEQVCRHEAHVSGRPLRRADQAHSVQAWPIHEPDWRREILRARPAETSDDF